MHHCGVVSTESWFCDDMPHRMEARQLCQDKVYTQKLDCRNWIATSLTWLQRIHTVCGLVTSAHWSTVLTSVLHLEGKQTQITQQVGGRARPEDRVPWLLAHVLSPAPLPHPMCSEHKGQSAGANGPTDPLISQKNIAHSLLVKKKSCICLNNHMVQRTSYELSICHLISPHFFLSLLYVDLRSFYPSVFKFTNLSSLVSNLCESCEWAINFRYQSSSSRMSTWFCLCIFHFSEKISNFSPFWPTVFSVSFNTLWVYLWVYIYWLFSSWLLVKKFFCLFACLILCIERRNSFKKELEQPKIIYIFPPFWLNQELSW